MYKIVFTNEMKRNVKRLKKRINDTLDLYDVLKQLAEGKKLAPKHRDHALKGNWIGHRECHVNPDLLLVYKILKDKLILLATNTGSHSDIYG